MNEFKKLFEEDADDPINIWMDALMDFVFDVQRRMTATGMTRADLARELGTSRAHATQILRGDVNLTLKSMTRIATATGVKVRISLEPTKTEEKKAVWSEPKMVVATPNTDILREECVG